jgi:putative transposase
MSARQALNPHWRHGPRPEGLGVRLLRLAKPAGLGAVDRRPRPGALRDHAELKAAGIAIGRKRVARVPGSPASADAEARRSPCGRRSIIIPPLISFAATSWPSSQTSCGWPTSPSCDALGLPLPRSRPRQLIATRRQAGLLGQSEDWRCARRSRHGACRSKARKCRPSFEPRFSMHVDCLRQSSQASRPSTGSVGDPYDHAMRESFFATLECELIDRRRFRLHGEARMAVFQFIDGF